ncbi:exportin-4-like isoform X2 [Babylonia areolata]|uniref:exportin-4-like isoform X2 n=1 Tax=Babylonia areolata TaxID=304850 RepID=UPI003FD08F95
MAADKMADQAMKELEQASQIVLAPPNVVTTEQRHAAENIILNFRKTKMPYNICRVILENSSFDYVLFQAATTIKEAIVREWTLLNAQDIESLRSFLLRFITKNISLQSYVREQILQTVAVILKRGTLESSHGCDCLFQDVTQLISSGNVTMQLVACSMLSALLNEYSTSSRMSSVGFTWEFHMKCKQAFEQSNLKRVFMFSLQVLHEIEESGDQLSREVTAVLNRVLTIAEQILSWEFTPRHNYHRVYPSGSFVTSQNVSLRPNEAWKDILLREDTLSLFFRIHKKVRHNEEMAHHSLMCISQLASLNGIVLSDDKARLQYLTTFVEGLLQLLTCVELRDYEHLGTAMALKNMVMMFPFSCIASLPPTLLQSLINYMTTLTCTLGMAASQEEMLDPDDTLHMEAYEKLLDTWLTFVEEKDTLPSSLIQPQAAKIFSSYMMSHLSPPHGNRSKNDVAESEEVEEIEEDDREKFADQLCSIGALARTVPDHTVPLMASVLEDLVVQYSTQLTRIKEGQASGKTNLTEELSLLGTLHEDLHWTLLVTTHILTEGFDGETPMIPSCIMEYSIAQNNSVDLQKTMQLLASGSQSVASSAEAYTHTDKVIRLIVSVLRLCQIETQALAAGLSLYLSPQVASTVMCFLRRWAAAYLLPNESYYSQMSPVFSSAFGRDSEGGKWTVNFLLQKIVSNVSVWSSETSVMTDTLMMLVTLVDNKTKAQFISQSQHLWELAHLEVDKRGPARQLASVPRRQFMKGLVMAGTGLKDPQQQQQFWKLVLETTRNSFYSTVQDPHFSSQQALQGQSKEELTWVLESLIGIAQGTRVDICEHIFAFLHPLLVDSVKLLEVYRDFEDMVYLILELFAEVVQHHLCYLGESSSQKLFEVSLSSIQMYSKYHSGKTRTVSGDEEENKFNDISIVMELLMNLLAKDFLDFGPEEDGVPQNGGSVGAVAVVLYGLEIIVPLMTAELLKFPSLCLQYYKLITFLAEIHADKFSGLAPALFQNIVASMEMGLLTFGSDINKMCLEALGCLAVQVFEEKVADNQLSQLTEHFLAIVFRMLLLEKFDMSLMDTASTTFFSLICCHQAKYQELVNQLLEQHSASEHKDRLLSAFTELTPSSLPLLITRQNKIAFRSLFDKFMNTVWGFLCVR